MCDSENEDGSHYLVEQCVIWSVFNSKNDTDADEDSKYKTKKTFKLTTTQAIFVLKYILLLHNNRQKTRNKQLNWFENLVQLLPREARNK